MNREDYLRVLGERDRAVAKAKRLEEEVERLNKERSLAEKHIAECADGGRGLYLHEKLCTALQGIRERDSELEKLRGEVLTGGQLHKLDCIATRIKCLCECDSDEKCITCMDAAFLRRLAERGQK